MPYMPTRASPPRHQALPGEAEGHGMTLMAPAAEEAEEVEMERQRSYRLRLLWVLLVAPWREDEPEK